MSELQLCVTQQVALGLSSALGGSRGLVPASWQPAEKVSQKESKEFSRPPFLGSPSKEYK